MNKPILSICIPTYNRADDLKNCLESLRVQVVDNESLNEVVEITISDNYSTDNTSRVVESYKKYFKNFKYFVNKENLGFDLNVVNVVENATGTYCWYLGDDDVIVNGGIEFVIDCLKNQEYDFVGVKSLPAFVDVSCKTLKTFDKKLLLETGDYNKCYFNNYCLGVFSVLVFDREQWLKRVDTYEFLKGWLYYETVLKVLVHTKKKMLYIKEPVVLTGQDCRWVENGYEIITYINSNLLYQHMLDLGFNNDRILKLLKNNKKRILIILLRAKGHGLKCNIENYKFIYKQHGPSVDLLRFLLWSFIFVIPNSIVIVIRDLRKIIIKNI